LRIGVGSQRCADEFDQDVRLLFQVVNLLSQRLVARISAEEPFQVIDLALMASPDVAPPSYLGCWFHADSPSLSKQSDARGSTNVVSANCEIDVTTNFYCLDGSRKALRISRSARL
jgi:hypothetical protein